MVMLFVGAVTYTSLIAMLAASSVDDYSRLGPQPRPDPDLGLCHGDGRGIHRYW
jgi:hypothetical protein